MVDAGIQEHRWKQAQFERRARSEPREDRPGGLVFFVRVGPRPVEGVLGGVGLGKEVAPTREGFQIEELIFDQPMDRFHVVLGGVRGGRGGARDCSRRRERPCWR